MKFGQEGLRLLAEIQQLEEVAVLRALHEGLKRVESLAEWRRLYHQP